MQGLTKPSTIMKIFDKMVEPILLYNCKVSMANIPENTDIEKFKKDMWSHTDEIDKVVYGLLRQVLGTFK